MWEHCLQEDLYGPGGDIVDMPGDGPPRELPPPKQYVHIDTFLKITYSALFHFFSY